MRKVKIKKKASPYKGGGSTGFRSIDQGNLIYPIYKPNDWAEPKESVQQTLQPVPEEDSNLEAEKGETAYIPNVAGLAAHYKIGGKKHSEGGTPLNLPDDSFIFSDTKKLKIKDPDILKFFGKSKGSYTPAELAKQYNINEQRKILADPDNQSDKVRIQDAENMIASYNIKLGKLALVQEAKKGFPQGIPSIALPYLAVTGIEPDQILPLKAPVQKAAEIASAPGPEQPTAKYGMQVSKVKISKKPYNSGGPFHAGPQDWANKGNALMHEGGNVQPVEKADYYTQAYNLLQTTLTSPGNEPLRDKIYEEWKNKPENKGKTDSKEDVINNFLKAQKQIFTIQKAHPSATSKEALKTRSWDRGTKKNETYTKEAKKLGLDPMSEDEIKSFQSAYRVISDLSDSPEFKPILENFNLSPVGVADQTYGKGAKPISPVDGWFGNTTVGQAMLPKQTPAPAEMRGAQEQQGEASNIIPKDLQLTQQRVKAPWWLQDKIKTAGAAGDFLRVKKYLPWSPSISPFVPEPTFYDPTRELASNAEQMQIGTQGATAFGNPQQYAATFSGIQGQGARNAADILGKYNNLNVGEADKFAGMKADIMNKSNEANVNIARDLYDKTTIANQQFDNAKNMARQELRSSYIDAVTNRANAQVLNTQYLHNQNDPNTGGMQGFYKGSKMKPGPSGSEYHAQAQALSDAINKYPNVPPNQLAKIMGLDVKTGQDFDPSPEDNLQRGYANRQATPITNYMNNE